VLVAGGAGKHSAWIPSFGWHGGDFRFASNNCGDCAMLIGADEALIFPDDANWDRAQQELADAGYRRRFTPRGADTNADAAHAGRHR